MDSTINFFDVSKQYNLGLTRVSLPSIVSGWVKRFSTGKNNSQSSKFWALKNVSFDLKKGQSLALIGPNGAGKSTILKLLANITKPTSGKIQVKGSLSALIELGAGFHPDLTGRENIFLNGTILGLTHKQIGRRFEEIVDFSGLDQFIDTPVKRYSSGMIVRLGFAVAACIEPEILLVDEVLAVGDATFQQKCMDRIQVLLKNGTSIIFVSHNLYLVQAICESAIYINKGHVIADGKATDVIKVYETALHQQQARRLSATSPAEPVGDHSSDVEITGVNISSIGSKDPGILSSQDDVNIDISYNAYKDLGQVQISLFFFRADGQTCSMLRTKLDNFHLIVKNGKGTVRVTLQPLQLVGGQYYLEAWFLNESDSMAIVPRPFQSDLFTVQGQAMTYDNNIGVFEPRASWVQISR